MTKVLKWLGGGLAVAMLLGAVGLYGGASAQAQSPPTPPARFVGTVAIDGVAAAAGTAIVAKIGEATLRDDVRLYLGRRIAVRH